MIDNLEDYYVMLGMDIGNPPPDFNQKLQTLGNANMITLCD